MGAICAAFGFCFFEVNQTSEVDNLKNTITFLLTILCAAIGYCFFGPMWNFVIMSKVDQLKSTITFLLTILCAAFGFCFFGPYQTPLNKQPVTEKKPEAVTLQ